MPMPLHAVGKQARGDQSYLPFSFSFELPVCEVFEVFSRFGLQKANSSLLHQCFLNIKWIIHLLDILRICRVSQRLFAICKTEYYSNDLFLIPCKSALQKFFLQSRNTLLLKSIFFSVRSHSPAAVGPALSTTPVEYPLHTALTKAVQTGEKVFLLSGRKWLVAP